MIITYKIVIQYKIICHYKNIIQSNYTIAKKEIVVSAKRNKDMKCKSIMTRVSEDEKRKIELAAKRCDKSTSEYMRDCSIASLERRTDKLKRMVTAKVRLTEYVNGMEYLLKSRKEEMPREIFLLFEDKIKDFQEHSC